MFDGDWMMESLSVPIGVLLVHWILIAVLLLMLGSSVFNGDLVQENRRLTEENKLLEQKLKTMEALRSSESSSPNPPPPPQAEQKTYLVALTKKKSQ